VTPKWLRLKEKGANSRKIPLQPISELYLVLNQGKRAAMIISDDFHVVKISYIFLDGSA